MREAGDEAPAVEQLQRVKVAPHTAESGSPAASPVLAAKASPRTVHEAPVASKRQSTRGWHMQAHSKLLTAAAAGGQPGLAKVALAAAAAAGRPRRGKAPSRLPEGGSRATSPEPAAAAAGPLESARAVAPAAEPGAARAGPGRGSAQRLRSLPWSCAACTLQNPGGSAAEPRCIGCRTQVR